MQRFNYASEELSFWNIFQIFGLCKFVSFDIRKRHALNLFPRQNFHYIFSFENIFLKIVLFIGCIETVLIFAEYGKEGI